jgi:hypothetical protein
VDATIQIKSCFWHENISNGVWPAQIENITKPIPAQLKRRLGRLGNIAVTLMEQAASFTHGERIPWITASRHGDTDRMIHLFSSLLNYEQISPTDFSLSVHNAIYSLYSIMTGNFCTNTALSAGANSFETGLLEAFTLSKIKNSKVGYIYYDVPLDSVYDDLLDNLNSPIAIAMILDCQKSTKLASIKIRYISALNQNRQPAVPTLEFLNFLVGNDLNLTLPISGGYFLLEKNGTAN